MFRPLIFLAALAVNAPGAEVRLAFELPAQDGIIEGIAYRPSTGDCFFGDVHNRCVWRRSRDGALTRFSRADTKLFGVFNLAIDERRQLLWAATSMVPETREFTAGDKGRAALVALRLTTGEVAELDPLPTDGRDHVLGDLCLSAGGEVYLTDSSAPIVWKRAGENTALAAVVESPRFRSLQGLGFRSDGKTLVVTDYSHGLFLVNAVTGEVRDIAVPSLGEVRGLDGIVVDGDFVYAVQNGREPNSLVRIELSSAATSAVRVETITRPSPDFNDLTLLTRGPTGWWVVANSGWALVDPKDHATVAPHAVRVFQVTN